MRRLVLSAVLLGCSADGGGDVAVVDDASSADVGTSADATTSDTTGTVDVARDLGPPSTRAYLHADVWSTFWNDRTRCGAERTFLEICKRRGEADCSNEQKAWDACDPTKIVYGQVGPEKSGEPLCQRSLFPAVGGCDARVYDFEKLRFYWYGAEWEGNWPWATLKVFEDGKDWRGAGETIAFSSIPNAAQSAMSGIANHGLGSGCALRGVTTGTDKYVRPFGAFAWIEVPTGRPVTLVSVASTNFGDKAFAGCNRGAATQSPWITSARGATLGCVHVLEKVTFQPGKQYLLRYGKLQEIAGPPADLTKVFESVSVDVRTPAPCGP